MKTSHASHYGRARAIATVLLVIALSLAPLLLIGGERLMRFVFLGRWTLPTTAEFTAIAQKHQYIVQALCDYKAEHGMLPEKLSELVPNYLPTEPGWPVWYTENSLAIYAGVPHTYVSYSFRAGEEGWSVGGDFGNGPLPVPKVSSTRPALNADQTFRARLAELDHRIASDPNNRRHHVDKVEYLLSKRKSAEAIAACRAAHEKWPDWWRMQMALAYFSPEKDRAKAETDLQDWAKRNPGFIHWWYVSKHFRLFNRHKEALAALREAVKYPLESQDDDETWVPNAVAFDAASYAYRQKQYDLVLDITRVWSSPKGIYSNPGDDRFAFRAAAELAQGDFDAAVKDADRAIAGNQQQAMWAQNLTALKEAASKKDQHFVYNPGGNSDWELFSAPEP